jgi:hypothetical protein
VRALVIALALAGCARHITPPPRPDHPDQGVTTDVGGDAPVPVQPGEAGAPIAGFDAAGPDRSASTGSDAATGLDRGGSPTAAQVAAWVSAYKAAHPGNGGKDWDINAKTPAQLAADPAAQQLLSLCGPDQRPVIPLLAWEYGGADHSWITPAASALVYCVYVPVKTPTSSWSYDTGRDRVTADVYILFPEQNPCKDRTGRDLVAACIGDQSNFEILVDTASLDDGVGAGLSLSMASTELRLVLPDGSKASLVINL